MSVLWTSEEAAAATGGKTGRWDALGVSIDTRTLKTGDLFVALKAARDGHEFVAQALKRGAAAALVSRIPEDVDDTEKLLVVKDVLPALEALGEAARARTSAKVIAVTGSVGKTSTKEMLRVILSAEGRCHAAEASYNNHWGVPLTLARMPREMDYAVIEIGMNHPGEIAPLARMARPHVALVTTVAAAHLAAFDGIEGIAEEKAAIFDGLEEGGTAVWNADISTAGILHDRAVEKAGNNVSFGEKSEDYTLKSVQIINDITVAEAGVKGAPLLYKISAAGAHFAMNGLGAIATCEAVGLDRAVAAMHLTRWTPPAGRGQREVLRLDDVEEASIELIDDAFNANPASMEASLKVLADLPAPQGRKIAVLGDMLELGETEVQQHADVASLDSMAALDVIYCVGPLMRHCWAALPTGQQGGWYETAEELASKIGQSLRAGDLVLVKGSKGIEVSKIVTQIRETMRPKQEKRGNA